MTAGGRRPRRVLPWLIAVVLAVVLLSVPEVRHTVGMFLAKAAAAVIGVLLTVIVVTGAGKHRPRR